MPEPATVQELLQPKGEDGLEVVCGPDEEGTEDMPCLHAEGPREDPPVSIEQIRPTTGFIIEIVVQVRLQTVVVTGTEISDLSTRFYKELGPKPPLRNTLPWCRRVSWFIIGPVGVRLGDAKYSVDLYVVSLHEQVLLGIAFLHQQKARLDL